MQSRKLVLYGDLAKYFGKEHIIYVRNVEEAIKYLAVNFDKDFEKAFNAGYYYVRKVGKKIKRCLSEKELKFSLGQCDLHIMPVVKGAAMNQKSKGWVKVGVGTLLAVVGGITGQGWAVSMGISIALSGIVDVLTYVPQRKPAEDNSNSTAFSPQNTGKEGTTIPVIYGKVKIGSIVVSSGTYAERNYSATSESSVIKMLQRIVDAIDNEITYSLAYALTITDPSTDKIVLTGNYYYYPGRYPAIYNELTDCLARLAALETTVRANINSLKQEFSRIIADATINQTLQTLADCLGILRQCYTVVGETCDIDVEYTPTYVKKRGWAKSLKILAGGAAIVTGGASLVISTAAYEIMKRTGVSKKATLIVSSAMGNVSALNTWMHQRLDSLYRQSYSEDLYARTLSGQQSRRATSTFTPLDSCFFNISVLQYYLENYTLFGL